MLCAEMLLGTWALIRRACAYIRQHEMHGLCVAGTLVFDRQAAEVAALRELTQVDLLHFLQVPPLASCCLSLVSRMVLDVVRSCSSLL